WLERFASVEVGKRSNRSPSQPAPSRRPPDSPSKSAAPMYHGPKRHVHAAWAQPVSEIVQCRSSGVLSSQNLPVITWPIGYEAWLWSTILGNPVVPEVK